MPSNFNKTRSVSHCQFPFSDGRRCRLPVSPIHPHLCLTHALRERRLLGAERIAAELSAMSTQIRTASDLNLFLTRLVYYSASQQIPKSTARTLAYLASLILQTLPSVKNEVHLAHGRSEWHEILRQSVRTAASDPPFSDGDEDAASEPNQSTGEGADRGPDSRLGAAPFASKGAGFRGDSSKKPTSDHNAQNQTRNHEPPPTDDSILIDEPVEVSG